MKNHFFLFFSSISLFLVPLNASAFTVNRMVWQISDGVTNAYLYEQLSLAERHAKLNELVEAAQTLEALRNDKAASEYFLTNGEPLDLVLSSAVLWYKAEYIKNLDPEIVEKARTLIDKWAEKAKGRQWKSYKFLFHRIRSYYVAIKNPKGRIETQKEMILYDPFDEEQIKSLDEYCVRFPDSVGDIKNFIVKFKDAGGRLTPKFELTLISLSELSQDEKIDAMIEWLKIRKDSDIETIRVGIDFLISLASVENPETIKKIYAILTNLALWQPANEDRMPIVALILSERAKIEAVSPDSLK